MTTGVWPDSMVVAVGSTGIRLPTSLSLREEVDAGLEVVGRAAVEHRGHHHAAERRAGLRRVAVERDLALELRLEQVVDGRHVRDLAGVVADGHVAAVVVDVGAVGVLEVVGDVVPGGDLVGREHVGVGQGHGLAEVEDVGRTVGALELLGGVDLVLAGRVGLVGLHGDAVLVLEGLDDVAVVGPVRRERDDVELALLLGRLHEGVHAAQVVGRGGGGGVARGTGVLLGRGTGGKGGDGEDRSQGQGQRSRAFHFILQLDGVALCQRGPSHRRVYGDPPPNVVLVTER